MFKSQTTCPVAILLLCFIVSATACGCAQSEKDELSESRPRDARESSPTQALAAPFGLSPERLPVESITSDMSLVNGADRTVIGTARREMKRSTLDGRDVIQFVLVQEVRQGTMLDTLIVDAATLLPIRYSNEMGNLQTIHMEYGRNDRVVSVVNRGGVITGIDTVITGPHLDAAEFSMLIPALPLEENYAAELPVVHYENGVSSISVRVRGSEAVLYGETEREIWLVDVENPSGISTHFIDKQTRQVLRVETELGSGRKFEEVAR